MRRHRLYVGDWVRVGSTLTKVVGTREDALGRRCLLVRYGFDDVLVNPEEVVFHSHARPRPDCCPRKK